MTEYVIYRSCPALISRYTGIALVRGRADAKKIVGRFNAAHGGVWEHLDYMPLRQWRKLVHVECGGEILPKRFVETIARTHACLEGQGFKQENYPRRSRRKRKGKVS